MNVLIYFPYNLRTVEQQSVLEMLVKQGHKVVLLTTCSRGFLHSYVEKLGVITEWADTSESDGKLKYYSQNIKKLRQVISKYKIDVVIAHQQQLAVFAGIVKKTIPFRLIYIRHNTDEDHQHYPVKARI